MLLVVFLLVRFQVFSQTFPPGFSRVQVANAFNNPTAMAFAPDGRIFVAQQGGALRVVKNGALLSAPFLQLSVNQQGERGLIGVALDPNFTTNQYVYVYYTLADGTRNRISRFTGNGDVVVAGSEVVVLDLDLLSSATNHNGGAMHFKNGLLYVAVGENANGANAQNLDTYHGKLLRINPNGSVPAGNPFTTGSEQRRRVWAYGLRNPYTFDVQPGTGRILVNDVGQSAWEEINDATTGGRNFGWPTAEGNSSNAAFTNPVYAYGHGSGDGVGCAITGGVFFNPATTNYPAQYTGRYFYQDLCNQWINVLDLSGATPVRSPFATGLGSQALALTVGPDGNLYYLERSSFSLFRIVYNANQPPAITTQPQSQSITQGQPVTFAVAATGSPTLTYQWQFNNANITGATSASYTIANVQPANAGQYRVIVSNGSGSATSNNATLAVTPVLREPDRQDLGSAQGLDYNYYEGTWSALPDFNALTSLESGIVSIPDLSPRNRDDNFAFRFTGYIQAPSDGVYTFYLNSDDGSRLQIGSTTVVNNDGLHGAQEVSGTIGLKNGFHAITITFFERTGAQVLTPSWSGPGFAKQIIPAIAYYREGEPNVPSLTLEAESAFLSGPVVASNQPGYSGTGFADYQNSGNFVIWFGNMPYVDDYRLTFRYALATAAVNMTVSVNGSPFTLAFPSTGSWSTWSTVSLVTALNGGSNTIRLTATTTNPPSLDYLRIENLPSAFSAAAAERNTFSVYPNPTRDRLSIDVTAMRDEPVEIRLMNMQGEVVKTQTFSGVEDGTNTFTLDAADVNNGVYRVHIKNGLQVKTKTVIVSK
jgi:glucose/arabinose dehydrogenase